MNAATPAPSLFRPISAHGQYDGPQPLNSQEMADPEQEPQHPLLKVHLPAGFGALKQVTLLAGSQMPHPNWLADEVVPAGTTCGPPENQLPSQ